MFLHGAPADGAALRAALRQTLQRRLTHHPLHNITCNEFKQAAAVPGVQATKNLFLRVRLAAVLSDASTHHLAAFRRLLLRAHRRRRRRRTQLQDTVRASPLPSTVNEAMLATHTLTTTGQEEADLRRHVAPRDGLQPQG